MTNEASSRAADQAGVSVSDSETALVIVDHGSRREESNRMLEDFVQSFRGQSRYGIIEPAHMELAEPSISTAFDKCVAQGAKRVVIAPYFLLPGKHWNQDIPELAAEAARRHPGVPYLVSSPIGLHPLMQQVIESRVAHCLSHVAGNAEECESCKGTGRCMMRQADAAE